MYQSKHIKLRIIFYYFIYFNIKKESKYFEFINVLQQNFLFSPIYSKNIALNNQYSLDIINTRMITPPVTGTYQAGMDPVYPTLNIYCSSRVANQRVNNSKIALLKYKQQVRINNCTKSYDSQIIDPSLLRKFQPKDGMIYSFKMLKRQVARVGNIKILICVCMYNESKHAINLTLNGIYKNIPALRQYGISQGDIGVVLIQDGLLKLVNNRFQRTFAKGEDSMVKFYEQLDMQQGKPKCDLIQRINTILDQTQNYDRKEMVKKVAINRDIPPSIQKNIALVYQNIWRPSKTQFGDSKANSADNQSFGLKLFSCFKHTNGTKLSSHLWFFEGFCRFLKPQFCVLLDVGTTPGRNGLLNLIKGFGGNPNVGGVSGFMSVDTNFQSQQAQESGGKHRKQNCCTKSVFSIQKAQQYQYIISHFLDKNQQGALGFLHVLPGAWSGYRYQALIKSQKYEPNLLQRSYFKMILNPDLQEKDFAQANMYLAEDRILSLGIYCQMDSKYVLRYVPDAKAYTDPMKDHQNLMNQRRRWINSSLFAFLYVYKNYYYNVMDSHHNFCRKYITLNLSMIIAMLSMFNAYITPAIYFFVLYATIYQLGFPGSEWVAKLICMFYVLIFFASVGGALTGRPWTKRAHLISVILAGFSVLMILLVIFNLVFIYLRATKNPLYVPKPNQQELTFDLSGKNAVLIITLIMAVINTVCLIVILLMHLPTHGKFVCKLLINWPSYLAYTGAYSQTMVIYAFCNVDDVSWGTKGSSGTGGKKYQIDKVFFVGSWLLTNAVLAFIFLYIDIISRQNGVHQRGDIVLLALAVYGTLFMLVKSVLAMYHHFKWMCCLKCRSRGGRDLRQRVPPIDQYWRGQNQKWFNNFYKNSMIGEPSLIIPRRTILK